MTGKMDEDTLYVVHGAQTPINNTEHANTLGVANAGLENVICGGGNMSNDNENMTFWNGNDVAETLTVTSDRQMMPDKNRLQAVVGCLNPQDTQTRRCYGEDGAFCALAANNNGGQNRQSVLCRATTQVNAETLKELAPTITEAAGTSGDNRPILCYDARGNGDGKIVNTITGDHADRVTDYTPLAVTTKGNGDAFESEVHTSLSASGGGQAGQGYAAVRSGLVVRRLTPIECERLMGFPDNWTQIVVKRHKHKPTTKRFEQFPDLFEELENGEWVEYAADSLRYKACGNSMCVNVMRWIGMRIEMLERKLAQ